jgi:hypothetical protein
MFASSGFVAVLVGLKLGLGFIIGAGTANLIYRSRLTEARTKRASIVAGVFFMLVSGVAGWVGAHAAFENGRRMDIAPWGEDLRLRNAIADNENLLCVIASVATAAFANVGTKDQSL